MDAKQHSHILIIGGGIIGCSIGYHLTKRGCKDVVILEKNKATAGATWHAAGLVGQLRSSRNTTRMLQKSVQLYDELKKEMGDELEWKKVGSLRLACSKERLLELKRSKTMAKSFGLDLHLITPGEAQDLFPLMSKEQVLAAAYIPSDGYIDPSSITMALLKGATQRGAKVLENTLVTGIKTQNKRVIGVSTNQGEWTCDILVNAAGMWSHELGNMAGVNIPACAVEHQYLVTDTIPNMPATLPTLRDPDYLVYYKPDSGRLAVGGYEPDTLPFYASPEFGQQLLPENMERFSMLAEKAAFRTPVLNEVGFKKLINGPIPYSADGDFVMGKASELDNFYVASGFLYGIAGGGGAGEMISEWILDGSPSLDLWHFDVRRFQTHQNSKFFLYQRALELYGRHYHIHYPVKEHASARGIRKSPLYDILKKEGAVYGEKAGWERPMWFSEKNEKEQPSFEWPNWKEPVGKEHTLVRERVAIIDQSSFSKFEIQGPKALAALQYLAVSNLDKPTGTINYTQLCNEKGGIEADLTITRLGENHFYIVSGSAFGNHDYHWIESHLPFDGSAILYDVTSAYSVLNLCGPYSREVLQQVTDMDVSNAAFPFSTMKKLFIGAAPVRAMRIGYVGELGYELHIPVEYTTHVYELLKQAGASFGIGDAGYRAIDSLRMEKGYLYWSTDITPDYNPFEAGVGFRVHLQQKGNFLGRESLEKIKQDGIERKLCFLTLEKPVAVYGGEAIISKGKVLGVTSSGNFGYTVGKPIVYGYLPLSELDSDELAVEVLDEIIPAKLSQKPLYDAEMVRLKS